jgi:hypothetical protein
MGPADASPATGTAEPVFRSCPHDPSCRFSGGEDFDPEPG